MLSADRSRVFQEVLAAYIEAKEKGQHVDAEKLAKQHPELSEELNEFFANEKKFASAAGDLAEAPTAPHPPVTGRRVGEYEILGEIARGGMGVVYRARHVSLQRQVALKMMLAGAFAGKDGVRRFRSEAEAVADLDHPNIVPIYDSGEQQGQAYFCMKLIDGPSLKQEMAAYLGKPEDAARLIAQIAHAVHHAHQRGILHRDLKPGNILLQSGKLQIDKDKKGKKKKDYPVSGVPKSAIFNPQFAIPYVTDFGLAKRFQDDGKASQSTAVVGTAAYMAPEQATGGHALTVGADVYSLGAVLFELLTGRPPFVGDNQMEVLLQLVDKEPPSPTDLRPRLDPDLSQICLKCLRKDPAERYASAEALAVELEQWLDGEPVSVRAPTRSERVWRLVRRRPALVFSCCLMTLVLIAGVTLSMGGNWYLRWLNGQLKNANEELAEKTKLASDNEIIAQNEAKNARAAAERERLARIDLETITAKEKASRGAKLQALEESRRLLIEQFVASGEQHLLRDDLCGAAVWFGAALAHDPGDPERETLHRVRIGATLRQTPPLTQMFFNTPVRQLRLSPAGHRLAAVSSAGAFSLWDTKTGKPVGETRSLDANSCEFSPDGQWLLTFGSDVQARLWSADTGLLHGNPLVHTQPVRAAVFSPDGKWLATTTADRVRFWDPATAKPLLMIKTDKELRSPAFRADGKKFSGIVEGTKNKGQLHLWDLTTGKEESLPMPTKPNSPNVRSAGFSRDGKRIYAVATNTILLWNAGTKNDPKVIVTEGTKGDRAPVFAPQVDAYLQPADSEIRVVELPANKSAYVLKHDSQVQIAQFSPTGRLIATSSANRGVQLWRADTGRPFCAPLPLGQSVAALAFSADDHWLACASADNIIRVWRLIGLEREKTLNLARVKSTLLSVSPDGAHALFSLGKTAELWDIDKRRTIAGLAGIDFAQSARWSADGASVGVASSTEARVFGLPLGTALTPAWRVSQPPPAELAEEWGLWGRGLYQKAKSTTMTHVLDCDGRRRAVWRNKGALEIEEMSSERRQPIKLAVVPEVFAFSPDRRFGAAGFKDGSLRIWDLADAKPSTSFFWHGEPVRQLVYSRDGRFLASASASGRVRVWDAGSGQPLSPAFSMSGSPAGFAFHPDGTMLHGWTTEARLHTWSLTPTPNTPADLLRRIHLAAGQKPDALSRSLIPLDADELRGLWLGAE